MCRKLAVNRSRGGLSLFKIEPGDDFVRSDSQFSQLVGDNGLVGDTGLCQVRLVMCQLTFSVPAAFEFFATFTAAHGRFTPRVKEWQIGKPYFYHVTKPGSTSMRSWVVETGCFC